MMDYFASVLIFVHDVREDLAQFISIDLTVSEKFPRSLSVTQNRGKRLV